MLPSAFFRHLGIALVVFAGVGHLLALQHRAGLRVVDHERPEPLSRGIGRDVEFVSFGAIQIGTATVPAAEGVLGPHARQLQAMPGVHRGEVEEQGAAIHVAPTIAAIHEIFVTASRETGLPEADLSE